MFKGIFRIIISYSLIIFSLVLGISLAGFSPNDLPLYTTALSDQNILGYFGAYVAMPFVLFYGQASWIWAVFSLFIGVRVLTGIDPKLLLIRFAATHYLVLLWATLISLVTNNFSFVSGGIFGSLLASIFTNVLPNIIWLPFVFAGFIAGVFSIWNLPQYIFQHYFQQALTESPIIPMQEELSVESPEELLEKTDEEPEEYRSSIDEYYEELEQKDQVPSFLQEVQAPEEEMIFFSKKPFNSPNTEDILRDADVDLLSPYINNQNPFYTKLEENREILSMSSQTLIEDLKDTVESLDDLDQGLEPIVPNSKWVRESGVSVGDFVRKAPRLLFKEGIVEESQSIVSEEAEKKAPKTHTIPDVLDSLVQHQEEIVKELKSEDLLEETKKEIPQHISNFPPISALDNSDLIILPDISNFSIEEVNQPDYSTDTMITESEKLLLQGLERKIKKQQETLDSFREKTRKKHQELANQYYQKYHSPVEEIVSQDLPYQTLTTSFALQDFEQEILELKKYSVDTQILGDDVFFSNQDNTVPVILEDQPQEEIREEDFFINVDDTPSKTQEIAKDLNREEVLTQQLTDDYHSPQFAALMRLELGPDISQYTQDSVHAFSESEPEEKVSEENTIEYFEEDLSESIQIKEMIQDFQDQHLSTFIDTEQFNYEVPQKEPEIIDFDDVISQMEAKIYDDQQISNEGSQEDQSEGVTVEDLHSIIKDESQEEDIIERHIEKETDHSRDSGDLISADSSDEPVECCLEQIEDLSFVGDKLDDEDTFDHLVNSETADIVHEPYHSQNLIPREDLVVEDFSHQAEPTPDVLTEEVFLNEDLEIKTDVLDNPNPFIYHDKEILLKNTESIKEPFIEQPSLNSLQDLDKPELLLMPSVATEGHLITPIKYPVEQETKQVYFPNIEDLEPNTDDVSKVDEDEEIETTMKMIEDTYESFNINMQVVDYNRGPTITRFELEPPSGLKLRTILNLQDDLALQAGTSNLRIISPVEGRSLIGIEVPNKVRRNFLIREQIESALFQDTNAALPLILGVDVGGKEIVGDLATTPHLLIAGTTGSGKSVYVNALIMGLLFKLSSEELKFIMIDPKMVELELYSGIPHLLAPIITKPEEAMAALEWTVQEMDRRYKMLSELGVRNIKEYKESIQSGEKLPYIVVIVDEFANLMLRAPKDTEKHISRLASMSRAVGIHLVLATQRPSVDVVTGVIKANFPSRIAFRVSSKIDSRTIIDRNGAETLLGRGDMLFMSPNYMDPIRIQSPYASNEDVARTVNRIKKNGNPEYVIDFSEVLARQEDNDSDGSRTDALSDPLFEEVLRFAVDNGEISASGIQRRFRVGYNRASRLIESMKDLKIISPPPSAGKGWLINITRDEIGNYLD
ncbi:MAG: DNA translocase FtsK 4TM domain-containing protein [Brevinema sp.]